MPDPLYDIGMKQTPWGQGSHLLMRPVLLALALVSIAGCDEEYQPTADRVQPQVTASNDGPEVDVSVHAADFRPTQVQAVVPQPKRVHHHVRRHKVELPTPQPILDDSAPSQDDTVPYTPPPADTGDTPATPDDQPSDNGTQWKHGEKPSDPTPATPPGDTGG